MNLPQSNIDFVAGTRRAYRAWRIDPQRMDKLTYLTRNGYWERAAIEAICSNEPDSSFTWMRPSTLTNNPNGLHGIAPNADCTCGIYAKYRLEEVWRELTYLQSVCFGAIDVSGRVIEQEHGVRAQKAVIRGLWLAPWMSLASRKMIAHSLKNSYNVPIFWSDKELLEEFPPDRDAPPARPLTSEICGCGAVHVAVHVTGGGGWPAGQPVWTGGGLQAGSVTLTSSSTNVQVWKDLLNGINLLDPTD